MAGSYELWLCDDHGVRIAQIDYALGFSASRVVNGIGRCTVQLPNTFDTSLLAPDRMIQVWRAPVGGNLSLWRAYFLRRWQFLTLSDGEIIMIYGPDVNELLTRRAVVAFSGEAQCAKTDYADDMMKEIVTESLADGVAPTPDAGTRAWPDLTVAADVNLGPTLTDAFAWQQLMTASGSGVLIDISKAAKTAGTEVFFDIVPNVITSKSINFQFVTNINQPGADLTDRVVFDQERGNLKTPSLDFDYESEINYVYGAGQGEAGSREIQQVYDADRYGASQWNRRETVRDARNQPDADGVREAARAELSEGRPKLRFSGVPVDTEGTRFGIDWDMGDKVTARYRGYTFVSIIRAISISVNDAGEETISARFDYEES